MSPEMSEASRGMEATRWGWPEPSRAQASYSSSLSWLQTRVKGGGGGGVDQWTGCSQPRDKRHVEREPRTAVGCGGYLPWELLTPETAQPGSRPAASLALRGS